ncbi:MAG: hypothetical protein AB8H79_14085, partial [Myxococcota bacterium]
MRATWITYLLLGSSFWVMACSENGLTDLTETQTPEDGVDPSVSPKGDHTDPTEKDPDTPANDCETGEREVLILPQEFPAVSGCDWDQGWNLAPLNEYNRAMREEVRPLDVPTRATICKVALSSTTDALWFDDHVTLSLNDYVLVGGGYGYPIELLPLDGTLPIFDWRAVRDTPFQGRDQPYWCLGGADSVCEMPESDLEGPLNLELGTQAMTDLTNALVDQGRLDFQLRTFGDDNESDCSHSDMNLELR